MLAFDLARSSAILAALGAAIAPSVAVAVPATLTLKSLIITAERSVPDVCKAAPPATEDKRASSPRYVELDRIAKVPGTRGPYAGKGAQLLAADNVIALGGNPQTRAFWTDAVDRPNLRASAVKASRTMLSNGGRFDIGPSDRVPDAPDDVCAQPRLGTDARVAVTTIAKTAGPNGF
jgi:hypothetical protein